MKRKKKPARFYDFRIEYSTGDSVMTNYHYYNCRTAREALGFQKEMIEHKGWNIKLLSIEKKNPFSQKWEDYTSELSNEINKLNKEE